MCVCVCVCVSTCCIQLYQPFALTTQCTKPAYLSPPLCTFLPCFRSYCQECKEAGTGGGSICDHGVQRSTCGECKEAGTGGGRICDHGKRRDNCYECDTTGGVASPYSDDDKAEIDRFVVDPNGHNDDKPNGSCSICAFCQRKGAAANITARLCISKAILMKDASFLAMQFLGVKVSKKMITKRVQQLKVLKL